MNRPLADKIMQKESYLAMINNSIGTTQYRNLYMEKDGESVDIVEGGKKSCALFVSTILHAFFLVESPHATVAGLERDMIKSGWNKTDSPSNGDILFWEPIFLGGGMNAHVGFYIGNDTAISNDWKTRAPIMHHMTYGTNDDGTPARRITAIYNTNAFSS